MTTLNRRYPAIQGESEEEDEAFFGGLAKIAGSLLGGGDGEFEFEFEAEAEAEAEAGDSRRSSRPRRRTRPRASSTRSVASTRTPSSWLTWPTGPP